MVNDPVLRPMNCPMKIQREGENAITVSMQKRYKVSRVFTTYPNQDIAGAADLHATKMDNIPSSRIRP